MFMIYNNFLAKVAGLGLFYRWHPKVALRYLPMKSDNFTLILPLLDRFSLTKLGFIYIIVLCREERQFW